MEVANSVNQSSKNSNDVAQKNIEKALQTECKRHPGKKAIFLHLASNIQTAKICISCIQLDDIRAQNYLQIQEVLEASNESELISYPVLLEANLRKEIKNNGDNIDTKNKQIDQYIVELTHQIQEKVEKIKTNYKQKIVELEGIFQHSKDCWAEIINLQNLQTILLEDNNNEKLVQFIRQHISQAETNTNAIKSIFNQLAAITKEFSLEQPNKIKRLINTLLDEINFFNGTHSSTLKDIEEREENKNTIQKQQLQIEELQGEMKKLTGENNSFKKQLSDFSQQITNKDQEIAKLNQTITALRQEIAGLNLENSKEKETNLSLMQNLASKQSTQEAYIQQPNQGQNFLDRILSKVSFNSCRNQQNHIPQSQIDSQVKFKLGWNQIGTVNHSKRSKLLIFTL